MSNCALPAKIGVIKAVEGCRRRDLHGEVKGVVLPSSRFLVSNLLQLNSLLTTAYRSIPQNLLTLSGRVEFLLFPLLLNSEDGMRPSLDPLG